MAYFIYKCRKCGGIEHNPHCSVRLAEREMINVISGTKSKIAQAPELISHHSCKDGGMGIADLQGFNLDEEEKRWIKENFHE